MFPNTLFSIARAWMCTGSHEFVYIEIYTTKTKSAPNELGVSKFNNYRQFVHFCEISRNFANRRPNFAKTYDTSWNVAKSYIMSLNFARITEMSRTFTKCQEHLTSFMQLCELTRIAMKLR